MTVDRDSVGSPAFSDLFPSSTAPMGQRGTEDALMVFQNHVDLLGMILDLALAQGGYDRSLGAVHGVGA